MRFKQPHELNCTKVKGLLYGRAKYYLRKMGYEVPEKHIVLKYFGESIDDAVFHIEKQFVEGMNWKNHGAGYIFGRDKEWHIDHIRPLSKATDKEDLIRRFHYSNLQPLWGHINLMKGNSEKKSIGEQIVSLRKEIGLTQDQLKTMAGISLDTLCRIEQNKANPTLYVLQQLQKSLNTKFEI